jgi:antitoxin HicB
MKCQRTVAADEYRYRIIIEPAEEGGYVVTCPSLRGVVTEGETLEEARAMAVDAITAYLGLLREDGWPIPESDEPASKPILGDVTVELARA